MRYKRLMRVVDICIGGISQLNGGGYSPKGCWKCYIHSSESAYSIGQNCRRRS